MQSCVEHFNCKEMDCAWRKNMDLQCWELEGTLCDTHSEAVKHMRLEAGSKTEICKLCSYYQSYNKQKK